MNDILQMLLAAAPTLITSVAVFYLTRRQNKRDKQADEHTKVQQKEAVLHMKMASATLKLTEANAIALRDGKTNGELKAAMQECEDAKRAYYEFLNAEAFEHITE